MKNALAVLALVVAGCSLGPTHKETPATYDLIAQSPPATQAARIRPSVLVHAIGAPSWLESSAIVYRLNYQDAARQLVYANSRWAAPPAALLTQRLRTQLAGSSDGGVVSPGDSARAEYSLRLELEDFSQVFDSVDASRGVIVARASMVNLARRTLNAQKTFSVEKPASTANAEGGVRALTAAGNELVDAVVAWAAATLAQDKK